MGRRISIPTDLVLERGSLNVLLGPTLSGKTSLMRLMAGLDKPASRLAILVDGTDVTGLPVQKRNVAMVYQQFINYPSMTVYDNIASPLRIKRRGRSRRSTAEVRKAGRTAASSTPYLDRDCRSSLSGGQQQRTALARALVKNAGLVLLDEPLANLDYKLREELREELPKTLRSLRRDLRLCDHRTFRSAAARRQHRSAQTRAGMTAVRARRSTSSAARLDLVTARPSADPPLNIDPSSSKQAAAFTSDGEPVLPVPAHLAGAGGRPLHRRASSRTICAFDPARRRRDAADGKDGDLRNRRLRKLRPRRISPARAGSCWRRAFTTSNRTQPLDGFRRYPPPDGLRRRMGARSARTGLRRRWEERKWHASISNHIRHAYGAKPKSDKRLRAARKCTTSGTTAAPMRCSVRPAAARPRCSTSSRACCKPSAGPHPVRRQGRDARCPRRHRNIAQVFQFPVIYDTMTVYDNLAFPLAQPACCRRPRSIAASTRSSR